MAAKVEKAETGYESLFLKAEIMVAQKHVQLLRALFLLFKIKKKSF